MLNSLFPIRSEELQRVSPRRGLNVVSPRRGAYGKCEEGKEIESCRDGEMAYAQDLKSCDRKVMRVRLPLPAPKVSDIIRS